MVVTRQIGAYAEELWESGLKNASASGEWREGYGGDEILRLQLDVSAFTGTTPSLLVEIVDTLDGTTENVVGAFTSKTGIVRDVINITAPFANRLRPRWTIAGTAGPSFTFTLRAIAQ